MAAYGDQFRREAQQERAAAKVIFEAVDLETSHKKQIAAIIGFVTANTLEAVADCVDLLKGSQTTDPLTQRREAFMRQNEAIRKAAQQAYISGNWEEFDKLTGAEEKPNANGPGSDA